MKIPDERPWLRASANIIEKLADATQNQGALTILRRAAAGLRLLANQLYIPGEATHAR